MSEGTGEADLGGRITAAAFLLKLLPVRRTLISA